jgi:DNA-binding MarR family transcriptional regulator
MASMGWLKTCAMRKASGRLGSYFPRAKSETPWGGEKVPLDNSRYNEHIWGVAKGVQADIKQTKPFTSVEEEAFLAVQRTADLLSWRGADMLKQHGLSPAQYNTLRILRGAGPKGLACSEIGERMINRDPDITRMLDRLERRGLVQRSREQKDRRVITTRITTAGLALVNRLDQPMQEFHRRLLGGMGEKPLKSLVRLLEAVRGRLQ